MWARPGQHAVALAMRFTCSHHTGANPKDTDAGTTKDRGKVRDGAGRASTGPGRRGERSRCRGERSRCRGDPFDGLAARVGEVSERLKEPVSKTGVRLTPYRGFESRPLRCADISSIGRLLSETLIFTGFF